MDPDAVISTNSLLPQASSQLPQVAANSGHPLNSFISLFINQPFGQAVSQLTRSTSVTYPLLDME